MEETVRSTEGPLDRARAEALVGEALAGAGVWSVRAAEPGERRWQVLARVGRRSASGARPDESGKVPADRRWREVEAVLEVRALDPAPAGAARLGGERYQGAGRAAENVGVFDDDAALVSRALAVAARDLALVVELEALPEPELVARLAVGEVPARARVIEALGARRVRAAVPSLVALVPDRALGPLATGALVAIGDPRAVSALIEASRDRPLMSSIYAVAQLGGREAEAWLFTLAQGHPDAQIRAAAKEAAGELERRRAR